MEYFDKTPNDRELSLFRSLTNSSCEVVKDCILPDTYGDVKKILATSVKLSPDAECPEDGGVQYGGRLSVTALFLTDDGEVASMVIESDYEGHIPYAAGNGILRTMSFPTAENLQCRLINPRKIGIRTKIKPNLYLWEDADTAVTYPDSVTDEDVLTFEEQYVKVPYTLIERFQSEGVESGDDIHVESPHPAIDTLLMKDIRFSSISCEAREGAVAINATAEITLFYLADRENAEKTLCIYRHSLPISTLLEAPSVKESHTVMAMLSWEDGNFAIEEDGQGERRVCECDFTYRVSVLSASEAVGYCTKDLYSVRYDTTLGYGECRVAQNLSKTTVSTRAKMTMPLKEGFVPIAAQSIMKQYHIECGEEDRAVLCGTASAYLLLQNRESGIYTSETIEVPFKSVLSMPYSDQNVYAAIPTLGASEVKCEGTEISLALSLSCTVTSFEIFGETVVVSATPIAEIPSDCGCSFTVYYPREEETLWDIAKKYRVREEMLILADSEEFRRGKNRRAVLIPAKKTAAFHTVITP